MWHWRVRLDQPLCLQRMPHFHRDLGRQGGHICFYLGRLDGTDDQRRDRGVGLGEVQRGDIEGDPKALANCLNLARLFQDRGRGIRIVVLRVGLGAGGENATIIDPTQEDADPLLFAEFEKA